jgi:hypothetical protein
LLERLRRLIPSQTLAAADGNDIGIVVATTGDEQQACTGDRGETSRKGR